MGGTENAVWFQTCIQNKSRVGGGVVKTSDCELGVQLGVLHMQIHMQIHRKMTPTHPVKVKVLETDIVSETQFLRVGFQKES